MHEKTEMKGPASIAAALLGTLQEERDTLGRLCLRFEDQLRALREHRHDLLEQATTLSSEEVCKLAGLRTARERHMRLLGRVLHLESEGHSLSVLASRLDALDQGKRMSAQLLALRRELREKAAESQQRCDELRFTLQYATQLGREMIRALHGLDAAAPGRVYTAAGGAVNSESHHFLNRLG